MFEYLNTHIFFFLPYGKILAKTVKFVATGENIILLILRSKAVKSCMLVTTGWNNVSLSRPQRYITPP